MIDFSHEHRCRVSAKTLIESARAAIGTCHYDRLTGEDFYHAHALLQGAEDLLDFPPRKIGTNFERFSRADLAYEEYKKTDEGVANGGDPMKFAYWLYAKPIEDAGKGAGDGK